jgi:hypothetical protein
MEGEIRMNQNLVAVINRIIAEEGEAILGDPVRLKGFVADYAAAESKAERLALGRCIEHGAYDELKNAPDMAARQGVKAAIARRVNANEGLDAALCNSVLDALEAALYGAATPRQMGYQSALPQTPPPVYQPQTPTHQAQMAYQAQTAYRTNAPVRSFTVSPPDAVPGQAGIMDKITRRTFIYALIIGVPWLLIALILGLIDLIEGI